MKAKELEHSKLVAELKAAKNQVTTVEKEKKKLEAESQKQQSKLKSEMASKEKDLKSQLMQAQNRSSSNEAKEK